MKSETFNDRGKDWSIQNNCTHRLRQQLSQQEVSAGFMTSTAAPKHIFLMSFTWKHLAPIDRIALLTQPNKPERSLIKTLWGPFCRAAASCNLNLISTGPTVASGASALQFSGLWCRAGVAESWVENIQTLWHDKNSNINSFLACNYLRAVWLYGFELLFNALF